MYRLIGADGREYGPITADQVRQWIAEHRANGQTKAREENATEWKTLADFPDFSSSLGGQAGAPAQPPVPPLVNAVNAEALAQEILARDYQLDIGGCISRGWNLVMANFWITVGSTLLIFFLSTASGVIPFGSLLLTYVFWGGLDWMFLKLGRGEKTELRDAFAGFSVAFLPLMLFSIVGQLLTGVGFLLCILPGVYLMVAWLLFPTLLILDKRLDFWPAMELSRKVVTRHWWQVFGLFLLCLVFCLVGLLVCVVGFFIALPITNAAVVFAYEDIFCAKPAPANLALPPA